MPAAVEMHGVLPSMSPITKRGRRFWMVGRCSVRNQIWWHDPPLPGGLTRPASENDRDGKSSRSIVCCTPGPPHPSPSPAAHVGAGFLNGSPASSVTGNGRGDGLSRLAWNSGSVVCHAARSRAIEVAGPAPTPGGEARPLSACHYP